MRIKIFQIDHEKDKNGVKFMELDRLEKLQGTTNIDASLYKEVFDAEVDEEDLEDVYTRFITRWHPLFRGHSMSISDVVKTEDGAYFCDLVGFKKIDFDESKTTKPNNLLKVVYVEPDEPAYAAEVEHTLDGEQRAVGGMIECIYCHDDNTCVVANEEAKLIGMEGNRRFGDGNSIIAGPFFVVGLEGDGFRSLTEEEEAKYLEKYAEPEQISQEEVEADTGMTFIAFK
jgi:hypothetical protein